jgi:integrase
MKKTTYKVIFNRKDQLNKQGKALIQIECYLNGKRKFITTGIKIEPQYWDKKLNRVKSNHKNFVKLNRMIDQQLKELEDFEFLNIERTGDFNLQKIDEILVKPSNGDFINFCYDSIINNKELNRDTLRHHKSAINRLKRFKKRILFSDINYSFVKSYENFLHSEKIQINTIANMHKVLKSYINLAIKNGFIPRENYPYNSFKVKKEKTNREYLTIEEIETIENLQIPNNMDLVEAVRDMFVFSCYTGLRFSDVQDLRNEDIIKSNGEYLIQIRQKKTKEFIKLPVSLMFKAKPVEIIKKYESDFPEKYLFKRITNQHANLKLKLIAAFSGIDKNLTFHISRHSFGTNLATVTSDHFLIRELMGHTDIRTSMVYIHISQEQIRNKLKETKW